MAVFHLFQRKIRESASGNIGETSSCIARCGWSGLPNCELLGDRLTGTAEANDAEPNFAARRLICIRDAPARDQVAKHVLPLATIAPPREGIRPKVARGLGRLPSATGLVVQEQSIPVDPVEMTSPPFVAELARLRRDAVVFRALRLTCRKWVN
jgi:hypothetical protein